MLSGSVEEDGLVESAVPLFETLIFDGHGKAELVAPFVDTFQPDCNVSDLLRFLLAGDLEFAVAGTTC